MAMNYIPEEVEMIVSSATASGATNKSADGAYFEVQLQDGLKLPTNAENINISVSSANIWWNVPNIITGTNDKMYITGPSVGETRTDAQLGYDPVVQWSISNEFLTITAVIGVDDPMPTGVWQVGDIFLVTSGPLTGNSYTIDTVTSDGAFTQSYTILPDIDSQLLDNNSFSRVRTVGEITNYEITIPQGLYDLSGLNQAIARELEVAGAQNDPEPLITLSPDEPTQRVEIRYNYVSITIDFTQPDTFRDIIGFDNDTYPQPGVIIPGPELAPNTASFNQVNYFLIHSDLTNKGIRFNNNYNQSIAQVLINTTPGSQIISEPFNPAKIASPELAGSNRTNLRFWLTDDQDRRVNTNGESWGCRLVITYLRPI